MSEEGPGWTLQRCAVGEDVGMDLGTGRMKAGDGSFDDLARFVDSVGWRDRWCRKANSV